MAYINNNERQAAEAEWKAILDGAYKDTGFTDSGFLGGIGWGNLTAAVEDEGQQVGEAPQGDLAAAAEDEGRQVGEATQGNLAAVEDEGRNWVDGSRGLKDVFTFGGRETGPSLAAVPPQLCSGTLAAPSVTVNGRRSLLVLPWGRAIGQPAAVEQCIDPALLELDDAPGASGVDDTSGESSLVVSPIEHISAPGASSADDTSEASSSVVPEKRGPGRPKLPEHEKKQPTKYWCRFGCEKKGPHTSSENLIVHMCIEHQLIAPGRETLPCGGCGKLFTRPRDLKSHLRGGSKQFPHEHDYTLPKFSHPYPTTREEMADTWAIQEHGPVSNRLIVGREALPGRAEDLYKPPTGKGKGKGKKRTASEREEAEALADVLGESSSGSQTTSLFAVSSTATTSASSSAASSFVAQTSSAPTRASTSTDLGDSSAAEPGYVRYTGANGEYANVDYGADTAMAGSLLDWLTHHEMAKKRARS